MSNTVSPKILKQSNPEFFVRIPGRRLKKQGMYISEYTGGKKSAMYRIYGNKIYKIENGRIMVGKRVMTIETIERKEKSNAS